MPMPGCRAQCPVLCPAAMEAFMGLEKPFQPQSACRVLLIMIQDKPLVHLDSIHFLQSWFSRLEQGQT